MPTVTVRKRTDDTVSIEIQLEDKTIHQYPIETMVRFYYELGMAIQWYNSLVEG